MKTLENDIEEYMQVYESKYKMAPVEGATIV